MCWLTVSWGQAGLCGQGRVADHLCRTRVLQCCGFPPGSSSVEVFHKSVAVCFGFGSCSVVLVHLAL